MVLFFLPSFSLHVVVLPNSRPPLVSHPVPGAQKRRDQHAQAKISGFGIYLPWASYPSPHPVSRPGPGGSVSAGNNVAHGLLFHNCSRLPSEQSSLIELSDKIVLGSHVGGANTGTKRLHCALAALQASPWPQLFLPAPECRVVKTSDVVCADGGALKPDA